MGMATGGTVVTIFGTGFTNLLPDALSDRWLYLLSDVSREVHGQALSAQS